MVSRTVLAAWVVLGLSASVDGQGFNRQPRVVAPKVIRITPIELDGTIAAAQPGMIMVKTAAGETWAMKITPRTEIRVNGTAELEMLRPGMFVRFIAKVDKRRSRVVDKVQKITIFVPSEEEGRMPGVFYPEQGGFGPGPGQGPGQGPGIRQGPGMGKGPAAGPNPGLPQFGGAKPTPGAGNKAADSEETFDIRGRVAAFKNGRLSVYVPNRHFKPMLKIELAEDAVIGLDLNHYAFAAEGDKVSSIVFELGPQAVEALSVTIELAEPLSNSPRKKRPRPPIVKNPSRRPSGQGERKPFEVAENAGEPPGSSRGDKPQENEEPAGQEKPAPGDPPQLKGDRTQQIVQILAGKPGELQGKPGLSVGLGGGDPEVFKPSRPEPVKNLQEKFGPPEKVLNVNGSLPVGENGAQKDVQWTLWIYGPVKLFADENGIVLYYRVEE